MTNAPNPFDSQVQHQELPEDRHLRGIRAGQTVLLLALLAATGAAWWTMQERSDAITTSPSLTSAEPLPVPIDEIDEAVVASGPAPARVMPAAKAKPAALGDRAPRLIASSQIMPKYPAAALRSGEAGTVLVAATIDANGVPVDVTIDDRSGNRELDRSALQAVRQWRFQPALRDGKPVPASVRVPVEFALQNS